MYVLLVHEDEDAPLGFGMPDGPDGDKGPSGLR